MLDPLRLYLAYIGVSVRSQMEYKASFLILSAGSFLNTAMEFVAMIALFDRFKELRGWTLPEAALLYGIANMSFALAEGVARGFDLFGSMVQSGDFDRLLLRPRSTVLQLIGQELCINRIGRFIQGLVILLWGAYSLGLGWSPGKILLVVFAILGGMCLFMGLIIIKATLAFWTVEGLEITNTVTDGGVETSQYPLSIYKPWFRRFFTFVVPLACVNFFPAMHVLGRTDGSELLYWLAPFVGVAFLAATLQLWKVGVRHYCSTGS